MRDAIGVVFLVEGDGHLGPSKPRWSGKGVNGVHLLFDDAALSAGFIGVGAPEDHEAALGLGELGVFLLGTSRWVTGLQGRLSRPSLLAKGATNVALHDSAIIEEVFCLPPVEWAGGLKRLLEVFWACASPTWLRSSGAVGRGHYFLLAALPVLVPPVMVSLG